MKQLLAFLIFSALSLSMASAEKELEIRVTLNLEMNLKLIAAHTAGDGTTYHDGKVTSVKKKQDAYTHHFKIELPSDPAKEPNDALTITVFKDDGGLNPMGYGLTLCSLPLNEIPDRHIKLELTRDTLDVTDHYHPEERHHLSVEGPQGFRNGTVAWPLKSDDGRILIHFGTIPGKVEITMVDMETLDNIARAKVKEDIPWKKWTGTVTKEKPTVWTQKNP